jgi:two-component system, LuxR family, sensor kinase FixL
LREPTKSAYSSTKSRTRRSTEAEREFQTLLDAAVDAIIVIDHRGTIEQFSLSAQRVFGYSSAEIVGRNVRELMPAPYRDEHDDYLNRYNTTHERRIIGIGREVRRATAFRRFHPRHHAAQAGRRAADAQ